MSGSRERAHLDALQGQASVEGMLEHNAQSTLNAIHATISFPFPGRRHSLNRVTRKKVAARVRVHQFAKGRQASP